MRDVPCTITARRILKISSKCNFLTLRIKSYEIVRFYYAVVIKFKAMDLEFAPNQNPRSACIYII